MNEKEQLARFAADFQQDVIADATSGEAGEFMLNAFVRLSAGFLIDAGEIEDVTVCYHRSKGMQVHGYDVSSDNDQLNLFISIFNQQVPPVAVPKSVEDKAFRQTATFFRKAISGYYAVLEESSEEYDMFLRIYDLRNDLTKVKIFLLTDGTVNSKIVPPSTLGDIKINYHIWDIRRLHRLENSGKKFEPIEIDFEKDYGMTVSCLPMMDPGSDYEGYLAVIPGEVLSKVYEHYGPRLLERNVRSFLQARGNVNKGIRKTIIEEPHRFFAYNNGISATADEIEFAETTDGAVRIKKVRNLQIVNGGQTTASLHHTAKKDKVSLKGIYVQAKLSVIPPEQIDEIVPLISRYANSQNNISDADFYANDPFHVEVESLSRRIWAPAIDGSHHETKWFYERARGQYMDAKSRELTVAKKHKFEVQHPNTQKFTKTDLAKFENLWMQYPHVVSLGAQKNFINFSIQVKERGSFDADNKYFEHLIAKAILFKNTDKIIAAQKFGGYKAQISNYTISLLANRTSQRINLELIWKKQNLSPTLKEEIRKASEFVHQVIVNPPDGKNITEWCKKKECWEAVCDSGYLISAALSDELAL